MKRNLRRNLQVNFRVTETERKMLDERIKSSGCTQEQYLRNITIDGYIVKVDNSELKKLIFEVNKIGININQIAHKINRDNEIYQTDMDEVKESMDRIWQLLRRSILQQPSAKQ